MFRGNAGGLAAWGRARPVFGSNTLGAFMRKQHVGALAMGLLASLALGTGTPGRVAQADEVYQITGEVWDHYQAYLDDIGHGRRPGAYAITTDGAGAFYFYCEETRCMAGRSYSGEAKERCESEYGTDCVIFAIRDEIKVQYGIRDSE